MLAMAVATAACGGSGGSGPLSMQSAEDACQLLCEHQEGCDSTPDPVEPCVAECTADFTQGNGFRADAISDYADCVADLACEINKETCLTTCSPTGAHESYEAHCRTKVTECFGADPEHLGLCETTPDPNDDDIGFNCMFTPDVMNELSACFDLTCPELSGCFDGVLRKYKILGGA